MEHVETRKAKNGNGLFATQSIKAGETVFEVKGKLWAASKLYKKGGRIGDNAFRYGPETYLSPEGELGDYLNHSCEPNSRVVKIKRKLCIQAIKNIKKSQEVLIDYSTILGDDDIWTMKCACGAEKCRGVIRNFGSLPKSLQTVYIKKGMVPQFILTTLE